MKRYTCIHGHFYQPPRENSWLDATKRESSAAPFHDWNERIHHECYLPNTEAQIFNDAGKVTGFSDNYGLLNYNFGPTLLRWMKRHAPESLHRLVASDKKSQERFAGHGNAIAQAYNHMIMPLASQRDKLTQVRWGIAAFRHDFNRFPEGMWLPETAVDIPTLEALARESIRYTILSPRQAYRVRPKGSREWQEVNEHTLDTTRAYDCHLPDGRKIALFFYDGGLAHGVAFGGYLDKGQTFVEGFRKKLEATPPHEEAQLFHLATDGESYGHHAKSGESALAYLFEAFASDPALEWTNYGRFLAENPPTWEAEIHERTSWSCFHGVDRWQRDCPCHAGHGDWQHAWREPLRNSLNHLKLQLDELFQHKASVYFEDPWHVRDKMISFLLEERNNESVKRFLQEHLRKHISEDEYWKPLSLLEMQHQGMLMFTSCGWFFDDVSGLETIQILQHACRAIDLAALFEASLEEPFLKILEKAKSNVSFWRDGRDVWERAVKPMRITEDTFFEHIALCAGLALAQEKALPQRIYDFTLTPLGHEFSKRNGYKLAVGWVEVRSSVSWNEKKVMFATVLGKGLNFSGFWAHCPSEQVFETHKSKILSSFVENDIDTFIKDCQKIFEHKPLQAKDLISEDADRVLTPLKEALFSPYIRTLADLAKKDIKSWLPLLDMPSAFPDVPAMAISSFYHQEIQNLLQSILNGKGHFPKLPQGITKGSLLNKAHKRPLQDLLEKTFLQVFVAFVEETPTNQQWEALESFTKFVHSLDFSLGIASIQKAFLQLATIIDNPNIPQIASIAQLLKLDKQLLD